MTPAFHLIPAVTLTEWLSDANRAGWHNMIRDELARREREGLDG